jgi:hypothetical protein
VAAFDDMAAAGDEFLDAVAESGSLDEGSVSSDAP